MKLTEHFTLEEFLKSDKAAKNNIDNTPTPEIIENLKKLAATLEQVRNLYNQPIYITSGYRCPALNKAVGGAATSDHLNGLAVDFTIKGVGVEETCKAIEKSGIKFDQLIFEQTWVHLGIGQRMRQQVLSIKGNKRANGIVRL